MEHEGDIRDIVDNIIKQQGKSLCLASLDLDEIPANIFVELAAKVNLTVLHLEFNELSSLPDELCLSTSLEELSLTGNQLRCLPDSIVELENLRYLHLNENCLQELPDNFGRLHSLRILNLVGNRLKALGEGFGAGLKDLTELRVDENCLQTLPDSFTDLKNLRVLEIGDNELKKLPNKFGDLVHLQILNLSHNHLEELPDSFSQLKCLVNIDISENHIIFLPDELLSAKTLKYFYAVNNSVKSLPEWFEELESIVELNLSDNELTDMALPQAFGLASGNTLVALDLSGNKLTVLPDTIGELKVLKTFHLGSTIAELERRAFQNGNWLPRLPESFSQLSCLCKLHLDENQLVCLPESVGDLASLEWLDVSQNRIDRLPDSFCSLKNLWFFQFSRNNLQELPEKFGNLVNLVELRIDNNHLTALPDSFIKLQNIELVDLFSNNLTVIPKVLGKLKKLQRLDLDNNKLRIRDDKVPKLTTKVQYAPRNPDLKDNWRGKARVDKEEFYQDKQILQEDIACLLETAELNVEDDVENDEAEERALEMAMRKGLSIWRSHTGPQSRESEYAKQLQTSPLPTSDSKHFTFVACQNFDDVFEDAFTQVEIHDAQTVSFHGNSPSEMCQSEGEDWDQEVEEVWQNRWKAANGLIPPDKMKNTAIRDQVQDLLCSYPPAKQAYTNSAKYQSVFWQYAADHELNNTTNNTLIQLGNTGQFEDADDM